jgi:hypothetical protein
MFKSFAAKLEGRNGKIYTVEGIRTQYRLFERSGNKDKSQIRLKVDKTG